MLCLSKLANASVTLDSLRCSTELVGSTSTESSELLKLSREYQMLTVTKKGWEARDHSSTHPSSITQAQPITIIHPEHSIPQREGKDIATDDKAEDQRKLVKASSIVRPNPDEPDKEEQIKKDEEEARLNAISTEVIKVVSKEAKKLGIHPKEAITTKAGELFKKGEHEVLKRQHTEKKFDVHRPFLLGAFGISELDELREIFPKKKNIMVKNLMNSLSRRYERLRQIPRELGIQSALPAPEQAPSQTSKRKQKHMKLEPETSIPGLECNRALLENGMFIKNMRNIQLTSTGLPSILDEGTRKSKPSPEGTATHPKDSGGNKQPLDRDIPFTTPDEGEPSYEGESDTQPMILSYADVRAILLSEDEAQESKEDILGVGEEMDDNPQSDEIQHQSSPPHIEASDTDSSSDKILKKITKDQWEKHEEEVVHYVNLKASIDDYYNENIAHRDQTDKLVEASMSSLKKSNTIITDLYNGLILGLERAQTHIKSSISSLQVDTSSIKSMMTVMYNAFRGQSSSAPSSSVTLTFSLTDTPTNVEGENATHSATEEPHSHTERETDANIQGTPEEPKQSTDANIEEGKDIAINDQANDKRKLVKASSIVRLDPDEPVRVEFVINEKTLYLTEQEIQEYWDKEEEIKKAELEARLNAISTEVIKVVRKQAKKLGIHPKEAITTKVAFGISELNELREIIPKKKNIMVKDLMDSLSRRYARLRQIHRELGTQSTLPAPEQAPSQTSERKQKHMELEPETRIPGLECNRALPKNGPFIKNMVIEEPEYEIFFTDEFGNQAFQRWSDIDKVVTEALVSYLVVASMVKSHC
nr:hypothetical protein [Tanacetum cinerariifolium]